MQQLQHPPASISPEQVDSRTPLLEYFEVNLSFLIFAEKKKVIMAFVPLTRVDTY